jgi:hypothetical protein
MLIPNFINEKPVDENGNWSPEWQNIMVQIITQMQTSLSNEGFNMPQLPTTDIAKLTGAQSIGAIVYDNTLNELKANINGTWKTVTVV